MLSRNSFRIETAEPRVSRHPVLTFARLEQIASQLGLSPHTTHHYVKTLYRRFGVSSRAEFMARVRVEQKHEESK